MSRSRGGLKSVTLYKNRSAVEEPQVDPKRVSENPRLSKRRNKQNRKPEFPLRRKAGGESKKRVFHG